ncbi:hypothetical protein AB4Y77_14575 [Paenarthrobacter sp. YAF11_1]|uniref:hypothetical protein n=1 Tax=Paenarthrobacter sp. YAF11_1 TaxID=3233074 RepID=UPI003F989710
MPELGLELEPVGQSAHGRTTIAYQGVGVATVNVVGKTWDRSATLFSRHGRRDVAELRHPAYITVIRDRGSDPKQTANDLFQVLEHVVADYEAWEIGRLVR